MKTKLLLLFILFFNFTAFSQPKDETIVCIHGFLGAPWNMYFLEKNFKKHGWQVINWKYNSRDKTIDNHAKDLVDEIKTIQSKNPDKKICFIAHSLGCLILRKAFNEKYFPKDLKDTKIVLIAPPNKGACFGKKLNKYSLFRKIAKERSGRELLTSENFDHLGEFDKASDVLIISGNLGFNPLIGRVSDGTVALDETCLNTKHKHCVIRRGHKGIIFSKKTFSLALDFLRR